MINPSASGWIDKFFARLVRQPGHMSSVEFYKLVRDTGFIYGYVITLHNPDRQETTGWTTEEKTKAALLGTLYETFVMYGNDTAQKAFIDKAISFYHEMVPEGFSILKKVLPASAKSHELEGLLDERIKTNENIISRNFSHILTNALLFMDILAFRQYLLNGRIPENYLRTLEETVIGIILLALKAKKQKSEYDDLLIKLFESSVRYTKLSDIRANDPEKLQLQRFESALEKNYLLDMAGMAIWNDGKTEQGEIDFLYGLAGQLGITELAPDSIASFDVFIKLNRKHIPYFKYSNPVKHFYDHATNNVILLIKRNKKRLVKELSNNGELMMLLTHSTHRSLNEQKKKKMKKQLLEVCKTIPSLTIFLLPGGSLLLPLLIKFIPQMLPSVFNENLDNE